MLRFQMSLFTTGLCLTLLAAPAAEAFEIKFSWDGLALCTNGKPNTVPSPAFTLKKVPEGTRFIRFKLVDKDVPGFNHGGGLVAYSGEKVIAAGAFAYKSPCPPGARHTYEWTATAQKTEADVKLGVARAALKYP